MRRCSRWLRRTPAICVLLGGLAAFVEQGEAQLPGEPTEAQLDAALAAHHSAVLDRALPDGQMVWFIVDADAEVLETGIGEPDGLEERLRAQYPNITSDFAFLLTHITVNGREIPLLWMIPEPPEWGDQLAESEPPNELARSVV